MGLGSAPGPDRVMVERCLSDHDRLVPRLLPVLAQGSRPLRLTRLRGMLRLMLQQQRVLVQGAQGIAQGMFRGLGRDGS